MAYLQQAPQRCLGFDIACDTITISDGDGLVTIANRRAPIRRFLQKCRAQLCVCEPTGGHERILLEECLRLSIPVHRADTRRLKAFIRSHGRLGKSDAIDARLMARYGRERWQDLALWQAPDPDRERLRCLVTRRADLLAMKVAEQNRAKAPGAAELAASYRDMLAAITRQIRLLEAEIRKLVRKAGMRARHAILTAMTGIGDITAAALLALMPELGTLHRRQAAALAGLAPHPNESGTRVGYRRMRGGRPQLRTILFLPALQAARGRGELADFYNRLITNGKKPIVAIAATMRKIITILNARLKTIQYQQS